MSSKPDRLERLLAEELGECCDGDIESRLETLEGFADELPADPDRDLAALGALGNDTRYRIVRLLAAADRELCVCELSAVVPVSDSAISHALGDLYDAGLVTRRKDGTWRYYGATDRSRAIVDALDGSRQR